MSLDASIALLERLQQVGFLELIIVPHQQRAILGLSPPLAKTVVTIGAGKRLESPMCAEEFQDIFPGMSKNEQISFLLDAKMTYPFLHLVELDAQRRCACYLESKLKSADRIDRSRRR
jgi:hypothetical protein